MLKTAFKPKWIATLVGALVAATLFVLLSQWQFGQSTTRPVVTNATTEKPTPLTGHFAPGKDMYGVDADQIVTATGRFVPGSEVLIQGRLQEGKQGYWVVAAFDVDGDNADDVMPIVRGWEAEPTPPRPVPTGTVAIEGRLLPSEAPSARRSDPAAGYATLSAAELSNVWDRDAYAGFVVAFSATSSGHDVGAASAGLEPVNVGPQPQDATINWLNVFYGVEWVVFAGFAFFIWFRLVKDDAARESEFDAELAAWRARQAQRDAEYARSLAAGERPAGEAAAREAPADAAADPDHSSPHR